MLELRWHYVLIGLSMVAFGLGLLVFCLMTQGWSWGKTLNNLLQIAGAIGITFMGGDLTFFGMARKPAET